MKQIAVVTGGAQGLGFAIAQELVGQGYHVVILGRRQSVLEEAARQLGDATALVADIGVAGEVARAFAAIDRIEGRLSVLVNNAGIFVAYPLEDADEVMVQSMVQTNLVGPIFCIKEALKRMQATGSGDIVNITSEAGGSAFPLLSVYGATKAGLEQLTAGLNTDHRKSDIRAVAVRVGRMKTEGTMQGMSGDFAKRFYQGMVESGAAFISGEGMNPQTVAQAVIGVITAPRESRNELLVIRSA